MFNSCPQLHLCLLRFHYPGYLLDILFVISSGKHAIYIPSHFIKINKKIFEIQKPYFFEKNKKI